MTQGSRGTAFAVMAGAGLLLGGAGAAEASQSFSVQESATSSQTLVFAPFDTSLGTLNEVDILLSSPIEGLGSTFSITGGEGGKTGTAAFTANLDITGPGSELLFTGAASSSATCTVSGNAPAPCSDTKPVTLAGGAFTPPSSVALTSPTDLAFWDAGSNVDVVASIDNFTPNDTCSSIGNGSCSQTNDVLFSGQIGVSYQYTPPVDNSLPEPLSIVLLGTGLAGLGFVRRRR